MLKKLVLNNGLRALFYPMAKSPTAAVLFLTRVGSKSETKELNGISHLLEHLAFRGTKNWPEPSAIARELDRVCGFYNAFTDKEMVGFWVKAECQNLNLALEIIRDMVSSPLFLEKEIAKEKKVIIEEINMREDNPQLAVLERWEELLYGDQPAGWPIAGTKKSVSQISRNDLNSHLNRFFISENSLVALAGGLAAEQIIPKIKKTFASFKTGRVVPPLLTREIQPKPRTLFQPKETDQTHLCLGVRTFDIFSPKQYPLQVLAAILGGMMSSRLFEEIREKRGLAYYLRTFPEASGDTGFLVTHAGVASTKAREAVRLICRESQRLKEKPEIGRAHV